MKTDIETLLPAEIVRRASLRGNEYAWPLDDIPLVIDGAASQPLERWWATVVSPVTGSLRGMVEVTTYRTVAKAPEWLSGARLG